MCCGNDLCLGGVEYIVGLLFLHGRRDTEAGWCTRIGADLLLAERRSFCVSFRLKPVVAQISLTVKESADATLYASNRIA